MMSKVARKIHDLIWLATKWCEQHPEDDELILQASCKEAGSALSLLLIKRALVNEEETWQAAISQIDVGYRASVTAPTAVLALARLMSTTHAI